MLSRRKFLRMAGGAGVAGAAGTGLWAALLRDHTEQAVHDRDSGSPASSSTAAGAAGTSAKRVLVVVQLSGGNDGLNTLVPSAGAYRDARKTLAIPEGDLVAIKAPGFALHPSLAPLAARWDAGSVAAIEGIAMKDQSRSHFKAMDTWWSATPGAASQTGWLGRWLDATESSPNPLRAIALGGGSPALAGVTALPTVIMNPGEFTIRAPRNCDAKTLTDAFLATAQPLDTGNDVFAAAQQAFPDTLKAIDVLNKVSAQAATLPAGEAGERPAASGSTTTAKPSANRFGVRSAAGLLQSAAGIIEQDIGTRIVLVAISGFDTHSGQLDRQSGLLADVASGIDAFFTRVDKAGRSGDVLLITTSEFGRRVAENASGGTDHGDASVAFVAGSRVNGGRVVGDAGLDALVDGDLPMTIDTRSLYAVALDWLGGPTDDVLGGHFDRYQLL